jgi:glutaredoxin
MVVHVYGKKGCGKCDAAKDKLRRMGFDFEEHNLEYHVSHHDGWRNDGSVDVLAAYSAMNTLPLIQVEDRFHDYSGAMRELKRLTRGNVVRASA